MPPPLGSSSRSSAMVTWTVVCSILFVTATIFAIYFYVAKSQAEKDLATTTTDLPALTRLRAAVRPARPAPTTATSTRFGARAVELLMEGQVGTMVAFHPPDIVPVPLEKVVGKTRNVPLDFDVVRTARAMGISLGD